MYGAARFGATAWLAETNCVTLTGQPRTWLRIEGLAVCRADMVAYALIRTAHIGFDRLCGFGLKYPEGFRETHLGTLGAGKAGG